MIRTQIYLTEEEKNALNTLSLQVGKKQDDLIREAVDNLISRYSRSRSQEVLDMSLESGKTEMISLILKISGKNGIEEGFSVQQISG